MCTVGQEIEKEVNCVKNDKCGRVDGKWKMPGRIINSLLILANIVWNKSYKFLKVLLLRFESDVLYMLLLCNAFRITWESIIELKCSCITLSSDGRKKIENFKWPRW